MAGKWKDLIDRTFGKIGTKRRDEQDKRVKEELAKMPSRDEAFVKAAHTFVNLTDGKLVALGEFRELLITGMELSATTVKEVAEVGRTTTRYVEEWIEGTSRPTRGQQCWVIEMLMKKVVAAKSMGIGVFIPGVSRDQVLTVIHSAIEAADKSRDGSAGKNIVAALQSNKLLKHNVEVLNLDTLINKHLTRRMDDDAAGMNGPNYSVSVKEMLTKLGAI